jgi:phosphoribulokinase
MSFASHLRIRRLGEFTVGTDLLRSDSLALVQLLILYHVVTARAALAMGGTPPRMESPWPTGADSAMHT